MKTKTFFCIFFITLFSNRLFAQSNPQALDPNITINRIMTVQDGAIRTGLDPITKKLYYVLTDGSIYEVKRPSMGAAYDSLVWSTAQHGVQYVQGLTFHDSVLYLAGNNNSTTPLTKGIIVRGQLQQNGTRNWDTLMLTADYQTADYFDHLFTGIEVNHTGDTIFACSGARGDHGEVQSRYGLYPGLRGLPITALILALPTKDPSVILLQNDSASLASSGYVFCRGIRSTFDMAFDAEGNLFGVENSGDYDHNEEMNLLLRDKHYGYPWKMGDGFNPQQYPSFNPANDPLINHYSRAWRNGFFVNDPSFPPPPAGVVFEEPIKNYGPDCDYYRDSTGMVNDASVNGVPLATFSSHRSPLGLVFDNEKVLNSIYRGDGFMLSWTKGYDSCGCTATPDTSAGTFIDPSQDLVHLDLSWDTTAGNFRLNATRIIAEFEHPVDADIDSNRIYVLENGYDGTSGIYEVMMPSPTYPCNPVVDVNIIDPCVPETNIVTISSFGTLPNDYHWYDESWNHIRSDTGLTIADSISNLTSGHYYAVIEDNGGCGIDTIHVMIPLTLEISVDTIIHTSCIGCVDGKIVFSITGGSGPYMFNGCTGFQSNDTIYYLAAGPVTCCIMDVNGCDACFQDTILDDPTGVLNQLPGSNAFYIYPNPVTTSAYVYFEEGENISLSIYDINGRRIKVPGNVEFLNKIARIDCSELPAGYYTVELENISRKFVTKLLILNR